MVLQYVCCSRRKQVNSEQSTERRRFHIDSGLSLLRAHLFAVPVVKTYEYSL